MSSSDVKMLVQYEIKMHLVTCDGCGLKCLDGPSWGRKLSEGSTLVPDGNTYVNESLSQWLQVTKDEFGSTDDFCLTCKKKIFEAATKGTV